MSNATHSAAVSTVTDSHGDTGGHDNGDGAVHAHISGFGFMVAVFAALIFLTLLTVAVSYVDLGSANTVVAVVIATAKASLVATFFMHLRHDKPFYSVIFVSAFVFLGIFLLYTFNDINTRGAVDQYSGTHISGRTGADAPGGLNVPPTPAGAPSAPAEGEAHH